MSYQESNLASKAELLVKDEGMRNNIVTRMKYQDLVNAIQSLVMGAKGDRRAQTSGEGPCDFLG